MTEVKKNKIQITNKNKNKMKKEMENAVRSIKNSDIERAYRIVQKITETAPERGELEKQILDLLKDSNNCVVAETLLTASIFLTAQELMQVSKCMRDITESKLLEELMEHLSELGNKTSEVEDSEPSTKEESKKENSKKASKKS